MHQTTKGRQWYYRCAEGFAYGMKVHAGVDKDFGLIHSVVVTAANVHDLIPAGELLHGDDKGVYGDAEYQGIAKRPEMADRKFNSGWQCDRANAGFFRIRLRAVWRICSKPPRPTSARKWSTHSG